MSAVLSGDGGMARSWKFGFLRRVLRRFAGSGSSRPTPPKCPCESAGEPRTISFRDGKLFSIEVTEQCRIACIAGTVWITSADRCCDYILRAGEGMVLGGRGKILISGDERTGSAIWVANQ